MFQKPRIYTERPKKRGFRKDLMTFYEPVIELVVYQRHLKNKSSDYIYFVYIFLSKKLKTKMTDQLLEQL